MNMIKSIKKLIYVCSYSDNISLFTNLSNYVRFFLGIEEDVIGWLQVKEAYLKSVLDFIVVSINKAK